MERILRARNVKFVGIDTTTALGNKDQIRIS